MKDAADELRENVSVAFESARAMPPSVYTSEGFLRKELDCIFGKDWFCVGRADALANSGDYTTLELAGQPIMVLRDKEGTLKAMSNVCRHRMSTLLEGSGNARSIVCPYHAWTYNLDGSLRGAPAMTQNEGFCKFDYRLPEVRCQEWLGWVFVTLNAEAPDVAVQLSKVENLVGDYNMTDYTQTFFETHNWNVNIRRGPRLCGVADCRCGFPVPRQELAHARDGHVGQSFENVGEPGLRVDVVHFCCDDQSVHEGSPVTAAFRSSEEPAFSARSYTAQGALGGIVREANLPIVQESRECLPSTRFLDHVVDGFSDGVVF